MPSLCRTTRSSCVVYGWLHRFRPLGHIGVVQDCIPVNHALIMGDYTILGRWAMSFLHGTTLYHVLVMFDY